MKQKSNSLKLFAIIAVFTIALTACGSPSGGLSQDDQVATIVAATLNAQGAPQTAQPTVDGEIPTQTSFGACANAGQLSLAYVKDRNVWLWVNGIKTQLTVNGDATDVRISSDGCRVAYSRAVANPNYDPNSEFPPSPDVNELWAVNSDGTEARPLAGVDFFASQPVSENGTGLSLHDFEWQPGAYNLAFNTEIVHGGVGQALNDDLYVVSSETPAPTVLLAANQGAGTFAFSPDGAHIAFSTPTSVSVINADGSNLRTNLITFPAVITYSEYAFSPPVNWGPDSNSLMVAVPPEDGLAAPQNGVYPETALWYIPLDGTAPFEAGDVQVVFMSGVRFSPDMGRIAYVRPLGDVNSDQRELVIALSNGSNELPTINVAGINFQDWSPDNSQFLYSYYDQALHFFVGNVSNSNVEPVSTLTPFAGLGARVQWVEGSTFVLLQFDNNGSELSVMNTDGTGQVVDTLGEQFASFDASD